MERLDLPVTPPVLDLLGSVSNTLVPRAVGEGTCLGSVHADSAGCPTACWVESVEGCFLIGQPGGRQAGNMVREDIAGTVLPAAEAAGWWHVFVSLEPEGWGSLLEEAVLPDLLVARRTRDFALTDPGSVDVPPIPPGYALKPIDRALLEDARLANTDHIRSWVGGNWPSTDLFLERGAGMCVVRDGEAVSWCVADCSSGASCEIGIQTAPAHRRRGLATAAASATVVQCAERGFSHVGWHCPSYNLASAATALRVGFVEAGGHAALDVWFRPLDACLANGAACLMADRHEAAAEWYARARRLADAGAASHLIDMPGGHDVHWERAACAEALVEAEPGAPAWAAALIEDGECRYHGV